MSSLDAWIPLAVRAAPDSTCPFRFGSQAKRAGRAHARPARDFLNGRVSRACDYWRQ